MTDLSPFDLRLARRQVSWLTSNRDSADLAISRNDLDTVNGQDNLAQALINRLHTRLGELSELGHPAYGSRLHELVGELNNTRTRAFAELYIRESLSRDSRVRDITSVVFESSARNSRDRHYLKIHVTVLPIDSAEPVTIAVGLNLER